MSAVRVCVRALEVEHIVMSSSESAVHARLECKANVCGCVRTLEVNHIVTSTNGSVAHVRSERVCAHLNSITQ